MELKLIKGVEGAEAVLTRLDPLDLSGLPESASAQTRRIFGEGVSPEESVIRILRDVRANGDTAVRHYAKMLGNIDLQDMLVSPAQMEEARAAGSVDLRKSLELAAQRVREFHEAVMRSDWRDENKG